MGDLELTVLGADGSFPRAGGACSGYLVRAGGANVWMDAGPGTLANLQKHISIDQVDAVVISHAHPDHWSDLEGFYVACRYFFGRKGVPVFAPKGLKEKFSGDTEDGTFSWVTVSDADRVEIGPMRWSFSRTDHTVETLGSMVQFGGRTLGYSADSGSGWGLERFGCAIDLALIEASLPIAQEGRMKHLSARQAGVMAAEAGVSKLVLTHLTPLVDSAVAKVEASEAFGAEVEVAVIGSRWMV